PGRAQEPHQQREQRGGEREPDRCAPHRRRGVVPDANEQERAAPDRAAGGECEPRARPAGAGRGLGFVLGGREHGGRPPRARAREVPEGGPGHARSWSPPGPAAPPALRSVATSLASPARMSPMREDDLLKLRWIADPQISPDGTAVAFTLVRIDADEDEYRTD